MTKEAEDKTLQTKTTLKENIASVKAEPQVVSKLQELDPQHNSKEIAELISTVINQQGESLGQTEKELAEHYQNIKCTYPAIQKLLPALSPDGNSWILLTIEIKE